MVSSLCDVAQSGRVKSECTKTTWSASFARLSRPSWWKVKLPANAVTNWPYDCCRTLRLQTAIANYTQVMQSRVCNSQRLVSVTALGRVTSPWRCLHSWQTTTGKQSLDSGIAQPQPHCKSPSQAEKRQYHIPNNDERFRKNALKTYCGTWPYPTPTYPDSPLWSSESSAPRACGMAPTTHPANKIGAPSRSPNGTFEDCWPFVHLGLYRTFGVEETFGQERSMETSTCTEASRQNHSLHINTGIRTAWKQKMHGRSQRR